MILKIDKVRNEYKVRDVVVRKYAWDIFVAIKEKGNERCVVEHYN